MDLQTELFRLYFTDSYKIFTIYATITDVSTNRIRLLEFHKEL